MKAWLKITGIVVGAGLGTLLLKKGAGLAVKYLERKIELQKRLNAEKLAELAPSLTIVNGRNLTADKVLENEKIIEENPENLKARCLLLGFYGRHKQNTIEKDKYQEHALWVIEHCPESPVARECELNPLFFDTDEAYEKGKQLWLRHCDDPSANPRILNNAARYFLSSDRSIAKTLLLRGKSLQPENAEWSDRLAHLYDLGLDGFNETECAMIAFTEKQRAYQLRRSAIPFFRIEPPTDLPTLALKAGRIKDAIRYSKLLLRAVPRLRRDAGLASECTHEAHTVLGRIALIKGDVRLAKSHLQHSSNIDWSPVLNSFGPNLDLAKELLERKEIESVLRYLDRCEEFLKNEEKIPKWRSEITAGIIPFDWRGD